MDWFSAWSMGRKIGVGVLAIAALIGLVLLGQHWIDTAFDRAEEKGASDVRAQSAEEGLKHVEDANKAAADVAADPVKRNAGCVRHSRTPENC